MADIRIVPGSSIMSFTSSLNFTEKITQDASGSLNLYGSGSTGRTELFSIDGNNGRLFTVSDDLSDSLFSVNTIAGLPVIEAFANNTVVMGQYGTNALVVSGSKVGIGTTSPSAKLDVINSSTDEIAFFKGASTIVPYQILGNAAVGDYWRGIFTGQNIITNATTGKPSVRTSGYTASAIAYSADSSQGYLGFFTTTSTTANTDLSERMRITSDGKVGIGTVETSNALQVKGVIAKQTTTGVDGTFDNLIKFGYGADLNSGTAYANRWIGIDATISAGGGTSNALRVRAYGGGTGNAAPINVVDFRGDQSSIFYGNVGIGNTSPSYKLDISGTGNASSDFRAPIFYDSNNTGYYVDPASTSNLYSLSVGSSMSLFGGYGGGSGPGLGFENQSTFCRLAFFGLDFYDWNDGIQMTINNNHVAATNSFRAPIFYDSNNTGYYIDPASTSVLNALTVGGSSVVTNNGGTWGINIAGNSRGMSGFTNQVEATILDGPTNGPVWKVRYDSATVNRYIDFGFKDGNNVFSSGLRILDGGTPTWQGNVLLHAGNYNSYSPTLTGGNASGTWGINISGNAGTATSATSATFSNYLSPNYIGGQQLNPQTYFNNNIGVKVAMTAAAGVWSDTLWINGYSGGDVLSMCALHFQRNGTPRMYISTQNSTATSYGTLYEVLSNYGGTGTYSTTGDFRAPIFYDSNNTGYYIDPAGFSQLSSIYTNNWVRVQGDTGVYSQDYGGHLRRTVNASHGTWEIYGYNKGGYTGLNINDSSGYINNYMHENGNGGLYLENQSGKWAYYWHRGNACLGIGDSTTSSSYKMYVTGGIYATGDVVAYSDRRKKTNITTIDNALEKVKNLRGVYYDKIDELDKGRRTGVIAQEVQEVLPEAVTYAEDVDEYGVLYGNIVGVLIEAIKEQQKQIDELKELIKNK